MWCLIPFVGLILGLYFGQFLGIEIPAEMVKYLSIAILAALDSVFGGIRALFEKKYDNLLMLSGFFTNALLAAVLTYIGDMLSIDLYYAAIFAFGVRLFSNLSMIRVHIIQILRKSSGIFAVFRQGLLLEEDDEEEDNEDDNEDENGLDEGEEEDNP